MRDMTKRLAILEAAREPSMRVMLDHLSTPDLERLEGIVLRVNSGTDIADLPTDDLRLITSLRMVGA